MRTMDEIFTKLFKSILVSTIWDESVETKIVWVSMLAMADRKGCVGASLPGLARTAGVSLEDAQVAIDKFLAPDPYSRTQDHEGRRIEEIDRGWRLLNYARFRTQHDTEARRAYDRERKRIVRAQPGKSAQVDADSEYGNPYD